MVLAVAATASLARRAGMASRGSCASRRVLLPSYSCLVAMASVAWFSSGGAAAKSPPPLFQSPIVTAEQVRAKMSEGKERIRFLDSSWHLDKSRDPRKEFLEEHIKGAVRFDIDAVADKSSNLPHMLPSAEAFAKAASELGLDNRDHIVVYTTQKCFSAARCWWTFRTFGHDKVYVLDGGLPAWKQAGGETETGEPAVTPTRPPKGLVESGGNTWLLDKKGFQAKLRPELVYSWRQVLKVVEEKKGPSDPLIVDARGAARFRAEAPEPRPGLAGGHMPGAFNVPFEKVLAEGDWTRFRSPEEIREAFKATGVELSSLKAGQQVVTTCGSGVTAAVLSLAMVLAGRDVAAVPVYDGSWAEWGGRADLPKEPKPKEEL